MIMIQRYGANLKSQILNSQIHNRQKKSFFLVCSCKSQVSKSLKIVLKIAKNNLNKFLTF